MPKTFAANFSWFKTWWADVPLSPLHAPQPEIVGLHQDRSGLVWVLVNVADQNWRAALEEWATPEGQQYRPRDADSVYDSEIVVFDPVRAWFATRRLPMKLIEFVDDGLAFSIVDSEDATPYLQIWNLRLFQRPTRRSP